MIDICLQYRRKISKLTGTDLHNYYKCFILTSRGRYLWALDLGQVEDKYLHTFTNPNVAGTSTSPLSAGSDKG